jgi:polar amino acid transport system substrate-binding protein
MFQARHRIIFFLLMLVPATAFADTILLKSDIWCPYNCDPDAPLPGYAIEMAEKIFKKAGHTLKYETAPWSRSLKLVRDGRITAVVGVTRNEAPELIFPKEEFGISVIHFFKRKGYPWKFTGIESLKEVVVGIMAEYEYGAELDAYFERNANTGKVESIRAEAPLILNIRKLLRGRIDVIPEDKSVFLQTARSLGVLEETEDAGVDPIMSREGLDESKLYMAFSPKNPKSKEYAKLIATGIREMRMSGELNLILAKYGLTDWREEFRDEMKRYAK